MDPKGNGLKAGREAHDEGAAVKGEGKQEEEVGDSASSVERLS